MNAAQDISHINWSNLKSKLRKRWGKITEDDIAQIDGNTDELVRVLRKRYGYGKAQAEFEIKYWLKEQANQ